ncbi:MAG: endonuclease MutS2 [Proteobacteria bacterium]|nr:endonuclease MutS2 [Pseudomonadota bacterium]
MTFPEKTQKDLEWPRLLRQLAKRCTGEEAALASEKLPFLKPKEAKERLTLVQEFTICIANGDPPPALPAIPIGEWLVHIRGEASVSGEALRQIAKNVKLYIAIARYLENRLDVCPKNAALVIPEKHDLSALSLARLAAEIDSAFDPDGNISDGASPELGRLRRRTISLRKHLVSSIEKIAEREEDVLQERTVTLRNDRFVIPVRADAHRRLPGIVHGASGSGATIFVEPEQVIETGNELMLAREEVTREEARILAELCTAVRDQLDEVTLVNRLTIEVEIRIAAARLSVDIGASVPKPGKTGSATLIRIRHPLLLLDGVKVVPNNLTLEQGRCIVISGPNAGGKTVVLKTIGLLSLMLAAGLPIPVDPDSHMGIPQNVLSDIGDDQSLEKNLSTFSAHMSNIASILTQAKEGCVILLDELASGTDPSEGAALAEAFLEKFNQLGATTLSTTHFDALKVRAQEGAGFVNAAVDFNIADMRPTFQLRQGSPGRSSALAVASRFGAPKEVIERARQILPAETRDLTKVIETLEKERRKVIMEQQALESARKEAEKAKQKSVEKLAKLRAKQSEVIDEEAKALWGSIRTARQKLRDLEKSIKRKNVKIVDINKARSAVNTMAEELEPGGKLSPDEKADLPGKPATKEQLVPGTSVYVQTFGTTGTVDSTPRGNKLFVRIGNIKSSVKVEDLRVVASSKATAKSQKSKKDTRKKTTAHGRSAASGIQDRIMRDSSEAIKTSENTVDLRGMMSDEAIDATDAFLDNALKLNWNVVFVLHGHGTGALKSAIRTYLKESDYVDDFRSGDKNQGGDGITVVWLR